MGNKRLDKRTTQIRELMGRPIKNPTLMEATEAPLSQKMARPPTPSTKLPHKGLWERCRLRMAPRVLRGRAQTAILQQVKQQTATGTLSRMATFTRTPVVVGSRPREVRTTTLTLEAVP